MFCRDNLPGHFTGHIYWSAAVHSCSSSNSCEYFDCIRLSPASASAERHRVSWLPFVCKPSTGLLTFADDHSICAISCALTSTVTTSGLCGRLLHSTRFHDKLRELIPTDAKRAHHSWRLPHLVSEPEDKIYAESERPVWAGRSQGSVGSTRRR